MPEVDPAVRAVIDAVPGATRRRDAETLLEMMTRVTGQPGRLWYGSVIGFGQYHYDYASGRQGDSGAAGFAPRKASTTIYLPDGTRAHAAKLERLGPHKTGVVCVYINDLDKVDLEVLEEIITDSYRTVTAGTFRYGTGGSAG